MNSMSEASYPGLNRTPYRRVFTPPSRRTLGPPVTFFAWKAPETAPITHEADDRSIACIPSEAGLDLDRTAIYPVSW